MSSPLRQFVLASALLATLVACSKEQPAAPPPPEVGVVEAKQQTMPLEREVVGRLAPYRSADVRARVPGVLLKRVYEEGTDVVEGQIMFRIDPSELQATLRAAQAQLAQADANYANSKMAADRARRLAPQKFVSQNDLDNAVAAERSTAALVRAAQADVETARINLEYANVRAPITGRAGKQQVTEGALVGQGSVTLLTTIDQLDPLYVNFSVSATELEQLQRFQNRGTVELSGTGQATVQLYREDGTLYGETGTIDFSSATVDPSTGSVALRASVSNADHVLLPGSFVTIKANLGSRNDVFVIPQAAIQRDAISAYAMVVGSDGLVARRNVVTDSQKDGKWLITSGLSDGDQVIVSGLQKVQEGSPAVPTEWKPNAAPGAQGPAAAGPPSEMDTDSSAPQQQQ